MSGIEAATSAQLLSAATTVQSVGLAGSTIGGFIQGSNEAKAARIAGRIERQRVIQRGQLAAGRISASSAARGVEGGSTLDLLASQASETAKDYAISRYNERIGVAAGRTRQFQSILGGLSGAAQIGIGNEIMRRDMARSDRLFYPSYGEARLQQ